jgi:hypothetical protein
VFDFIEGFYNRRHRHSSIGYLSPIDYERLHAAAMAGRRTGKRFGPRLARLSLGFRHTPSPIMRILRLAATIAIAASIALSAIGTAAQNTPNPDVLRGLAPVTVLDQTNAGRAALAGNYSSTGAIQHGAADQPTLLPFAMQQQQALRDAFITDLNGPDLADGLETGFLFRIC